MKYHSG